RPLALWLSASGEGELVTTIAAPVYKNKARSTGDKPKIRRVRWTSERSAVSSRLDLIQVERESGTTEFNLDDWVKVELSPGESITLNWMFEFDQEAVHCDLPKARRRK